MFVSLKKLKMIGIMACIFLAIFRPRIVTANSTFTSLYWLGYEVITAFSIIFIFMKIKEKGVKAFSPIVYLIAIYCLFEMVAQYLNGLFTISGFVNLWVFIAVAAFSDHYIKKDCKTFFSFLSVFTGILIFINNVSYFVIYLLPNITDATGNIVYFWQTRNHMSSLFMLNIVSSLLANGMLQSRVMKKWSWFVWANTIWSVLIFNSSTTVVGFAVMLLLIVLFSHNRASFKPQLLFISTLIVNFSMVIFRVQDVFAWLIETILKKSLTFTNRTLIWDSALLKIMGKPLYGYGESNVFKYSFASDAIPAHNQLLDVAIKCGLIGLVLFLLLFMYFFKTAAKHPESRPGMYVTSAMLSFMVMMITESCSPYQPWYIMMPIICNLSIIDSEYRYTVWRIKSSGKLLKEKKGGIKIEKQGR